MLKLIATKVILMLLMNLSHDSGNVQSMPMPYQHQSSKNYDNRLHTYYDDEVVSTYRQNFLLFKHHFPI